MNSLDSVIKDYLEIPCTDYAIMINGEWGCGKTHYLHNDFVNLVNDISVPQNDTSEIKKSKKKLFHFGQINETVNTYSPVFISLYGVSSVEDFEYKVFCGINKWAEGRLFRVVSSFVGKYAETKGVSCGKIDLSAVTFIDKSHILVFDDLERICEDKISVKEVLGLINSYAEQYNNKVIIVCNENEYSLRNKDSNKIAGETKYVDYSKYKEKSVRLTYQFVPDEASVYDKMIEGIRNVNYKSFLINNKSSILSFFKLGGKRNLRTLKFFIDTFVKIYETTKNTRYREKIVYSYMVSFMLYACEHKIGKSVEELESLDKSKYIIDTNAFLGIPRSTKKEDAKGKDYLTDFNERYSEVLSDFKPNHLLINYIKTGYLDIAEFKKHVLALDAEIDNLEEKEQGRVYQKLSRMSEIEDTEVASLIKDMLKYVKEEKYNLYELLNVYALLLKFDYWKIGGFQLTEKLDEVFLDAIERQRGSHKYNPMFDVSTPIWDSSETNWSQYEKYKNIKDAALNINRQAKEKDDIIEGETFLAIVKSGDVARMRNYRKNEEGRISVAGIDWNQVAELINNAPNSVACELCKCLIFFIPNSGFLNPDERDRVIKELLPVLNKYLGKEDNRIRRIFVIELKNHLQKEFRAML